MRWKWQGEKRRHLGQRTQVERFVQMGPDVFDDGVDPPLIIGCRGWFVLHLGDKGILRRGNGLFRFCEFALHHPPESPPAEKVTQHHRTSVNILFRGPFAVLPDSLPLAGQIAVPPQEIAVGAEHRPEIVAPPLHQIGQGRQQVERRTHDGNRDPLHGRRALVEHRQIIAMVVEDFGRRIGRERTAARW